jgi:deoxyribonuclease IV
MRIGLHSSVRHGMVKALEEAAGFGCETVQMFTRAPRLWRTARLDESEAASFRARRRQLGLFPLVMHTPFLPNLCTQDSLVAERTERALAHDLNICQRLEADYLVIHPGAYSVGATGEDGISRMMQAVNDALERAPGPSILVENMAGGGRRVGSRWEELAQMLALCRYPDRLGICLDTAHTIGAGHRLTTPEEALGTLDALHAAVGLAKVRVIHVNDSEAALGSHRDMHEHLGRGVMGLRGLEALLRHPELRDPALILETPRDSRADDERNLAILRKIAA